MCLTHSCYSLFLNVLLFVSVWVEVHLLAFGWAVGMALWLLQRPCPDSGRWWQGHTAGPALHPQPCEGVCSSHSSFLRLMGGRLPTKQHSFLSVGLAPQQMWVGPVPSQRSAVPLAHCLTLSVRPCLVCSRCWWAVACPQTPLWTSCPRLSAEPNLIVQPSCAVGSLRE